MTAKKVDNVWDGMPRVAFDAIKEYLGEIIDKLRLADWTVVISKDQSEADCYAQMNVTYGRRYATITLCDNFLTLEPAVQRHTLIHELLHCHTDPIRANLEGVINRLYGQVAWGTLYGAVHRDVEIMTDDLAEAFAPYFPLPEFPKGDE